MSVTMVCFNADVSSHILGPSKFILKPFNRGHDCQFVLKREMML